MWMDDYEFDLSVFISAFIFVGWSTACLDSWTVKIKRLTTRSFVRVDKGQEVGHNSVECEVDFYPFWFYVFY